MTAPSAHATAQAYSPRQRRLALWVVALAFVLDLLDVTIVKVAIPAIQRSLGAGNSAVQWMVAGYALVFAVLLITGGRLGDVYGYRRLFLWGVAGFTVASALCGLATSAGMLVAARLLQSGTAALMVPQVMALVQVMYSPAQRFKVFAVFGLLGGSSAALGPIIGGALIEADLGGLGWRPVFLINLPVGLFSLLAGWRLLPAGRGTARLALDLAGTLLSIITLTACVLPLIQGPGLGWPAGCLVLLALSLPLAALTWRYWGWRQAHGGSALVDPTLLRQPGVACGLLCSLCLNGVVPAYLLVLTFVLQQGLAVGPLQMSLLCLPIAAGAMVSISWLGQRLVLRWGARTIALGTLLQAGAVLLLAAVLAGASEAGLGLAGLQAAAALAGDWRTLPLFGLLLLVGAALRLGLPAMRTGSDRR